MRSLSCSLLIVFAVLCVAARCQDSRDDSGWQLPKYDKGCESLMKVVHQEWLQTDGELTIVFGKKLIWALLLEPNAFYQEMSQDTVSYKRFLESVENTVFRNFSDTTTSHLERLRLVAVDRLLDQTYSIDSNYIELHEDLIEKFKHIEPTFVD